MANKVSAEKRARQTKRKTVRNTNWRSKIRTLAKAAPKSKEDLLAAVSFIEKAANKGILHRNNASRRISKLMKNFKKA